MKASRRSPANPKNETSAKASYAAPALSKGLRILELLATAPEPMLPVDIARRLDQSLSQLFRMLVVLEQEGYVRRHGPGGGYELTLRLFSLGQLSEPVRHVLEAAREPMRDFGQKTAQECHLSILEDGRLVVLASRPAPQAVGLQVRQGSVHNPFRTVSGYMLLAHLPEPERRIMIEKARKAFPGPHPRPAEIETQLAAMRREKVRGDNANLQGIRDVAVRLVAGGGAWQGALTSAFFPSSLTAAQSQAVEDELLAAARRIHQHLEP